LSEVNYTVTEKKISVCWMYV